MSIKNISIYDKCITCADCMESWLAQCPVCKSTEGKWISSHGKKLIEGKLTRKSKKIFKNTVSSRIVIVGQLYKKSKKSNRPKQVIINTPIKKHERFYWMNIHPKRVVSLIMKGHDAACACCMTIENLTFDHIIPTSKGGSNKLLNGQILCKECNVLKGDLIIDLVSLYELVINKQPVR